MPRLRAATHEGVFAAGMALLLCLFAAGVIGATRSLDGQPAVRMQTLTTIDGGPARGDAVEALLVPGGVPRDVAARLRFALPPTDPTQARWVLWLGRDPVDAVWLQGRAGDGSSWRSVTHDFFHPAAIPGMAATGFVFPLPSTWQGDIELDLHARGSVRSALRPRLMREDTGMQLGYRAVALAATAYASLFMLALIALVLYPAVREPSFLALFACAAVTMLLMATRNGHLYLLPGFSLLAGWRGQAIWALVLLFSATMVQLLMRYAEMGEAVPRARLYDRYSIVLVALAALCLLDLQPLATWMQPLATLGWIGAGIGAVAIMVDAGRRRVPMAKSILGLLLLTLAAALANEAMARGYLPEMVWTRLGYQFALVVVLAVISLGLLGRISEYRAQRDRDHLARIDTEKRMHRETARTELTLALQTRLRSPSAADIEWNAFRLLLDHLLPQVSVESAAVVTRGYHGRDALLVEPPARQQTLRDDLTARALMLKRQAANGVPLQQPLAGDAGGQRNGTEALIPLPIRAPGWGMLLLQRSGSEGFTTEEMALAGEFSRMTVLHADEVLAAIELRLSAELDALTGSHNRRTIDQALTRCFVDAHRAGQPLSLLFIDIDHFKAVNDRHGHACGDQCLRQVAAALHGALGGGDLLGRYGGEEFIAVLPGRGAAEARAVAEQLRAAVERCGIDWQGQTLRLTVSLGVASRQAQEHTPAATVERADKALYAAKRAGRNCVQVAPAVFI